VSIAIIGLIQKNSKIPESFFMAKLREVEKICLKGLPKLKNKMLRK